MNRYRVTMVRFANGRADDYQVVVEAFGAEDACQEADRIAERDGIDAYASHAVQVCELEHGLAVA